jgi:RNA polymerase sigma-70 factor (family 1)
MLPLIDQLQLYDERTFASIYKKYYAALVFFANRIVKKSDEAEDIVTEVFTRLWGKRADFNGEATIRAFLYVSTRNACLNKIEWEQCLARGKRSFEYISEKHQTHVLNEITRAEVLREALSLIETLPLQCRRIIKMTYRQGLKTGHIANIMQLSKHTVRNQQRRGIVLIREQMVKYN